MQKVISVSLMLLSLSVFSLNSNAATVPCSVINSTQYVPSSGFAQIGEDTESRYIIQYMYWLNEARLSWFKVNGKTTYEPDAFFYNHDGLAYGDAPSGYWESDLPSPYVDTQLFDEGVEKAVTIGSAAASLITAGRFYKTITRMTNGAGNSSLVKLSSQRGLRVPFLCYDALCSFGCTTFNNYRTVPFQAQFSAPGLRSYTWP